MNTGAEANFRIPTPAELAETELANAEIERAGEIINLKNEMAATGARIMAALETAFAERKIRSGGCDFKIAGLESKAIDLYDETHCEMLQTRMNELLAPHGWQCEIFEATCSLFIFPARAGQ